ncbi:MAG: lectin like domain-containing protein, partial [Methanomicrobiales archaeon]
IALVGWDDTYSASNFNDNPGMDGAFIARNSWGTGWGDAGYFYISYANYPIQTITMFTGESATNYDNIYQYDPLGWIGSTGYGGQTAWFANIFTAEGDENLDAVSFYAGQYNAPYEVYIYKNPTSSPTDGTLVSSTSGTLTMPGYRTVALPSSVSLSAGDRFSVVVELTTPGYGYPIPIEYPVPNYSSKATANPGESYVSSDGSTWNDLTGSYANGNVCLKAFTSDAGQALASIVVSPATATLTVGETQTFTATGYDSSGDVMTITPSWTSGNTTVGSVSQAGLFTASAAGTATVTAESEGISGNAAVTVNAAPVINASVTRSISPSSPSPNDTVTVTLTPSSTLPVSPGWGVTETLDTSLVYVNGSSTADSVEQVGAHQYQFTRLGSSAFTYQVTAPATGGTYTVTGTYVDGEQGEGTVGGTTSITVSDLINRYTDPSTGKVEKDGAVQAVNDYLFSGIISKDDAITVVNAYLFG